MARVKIKRHVYGRLNGKPFPEPGNVFEGTNEVCARLVTFGFAEAEDAPDSDADAALTKANQAEARERDEAFARALKEAAEREEAEAAELAEREAAQAAEEAATEAAKRETATESAPEKRGPGRPRKNTN
jgi:hypothetical protein